MSHLFSTARLGLTIAVAATAPAAPAAAQQPPSGANPVREVVIAKSTSKTRQSGLVGGYGTVAWAESRVRSGKTRWRVVAKTGRRVARGAWGKGFPRLSIVRRIDERTGRVVVRITNQQCADGSADCAVRLLSTKTVRPTKSVFPPEPQRSTHPEENAPVTSTDGPVRVTATTLPDTGRELPAEYTNDPPANCSFAVSGDDTLVQLPAIPDCRASSVTLNGAYVTVTASVPSRSGLISRFPIQPYGVYRTQLLDLAHPSKGWTLLGETQTGKGGVSGLQQHCLLDESVARLNGAVEYYDGTNPASWQITVQPLRGTGPSWSAPAPQFASTTADPPGAINPRGSRKRDVSIACSGGAVYALVQEEWSARSRSQGSSRVVRLMPPR